MTVYLLTFKIAMLESLDQVGGFVVTMDQVR